MPVHVFLGPFLVALAVRFPFMIGAFLDPSWAQAPDSPLYQALAAILFRDGDFPSMFRTPGYPLYLSAWYRLGFPDPAYPVAAQLGLDAITTGLTAVLAYRLFGRPSAAWLAGLLYGLNPNVLYQASHILTESLLTLVLLIAVLALHRSNATRSAIHLAIAAAFFILAAYLKPVAAYAPIALAGLAWFRRGSAGSTGIRYTCVALAVLLAMTPWMFRNHARYGIWGFSTVPDFNLMSMSVPISLAVKREPFTPRYLVMGVDREKTYDEVWQTLKGKYGWEGPKMVAVIPDPAKSVILRGEFFEFFKNNGPAFFLAQAYGHWMFFRPFAPHPLITPRLVPGRTAGIILTVAGFLIDLASFVLLCLSALQLVRRSPRFSGRWSRGVLWTLVLYFMLAHLHSGASRFRTPVQPYICILAAGALTALRRPPISPERDSGSVH